MRQLKIQKSITNRSSEALDKYLVEIGRAPLISIDEEIELAQKIKKGGREGERAKDKLVTANLRFVVSVAKQYQHQGLTLTDLIDEGNIGLIKAAQKFDETRGFKFISYAIWWIRQSIISALGEYGSLIRKPQSQIGISNKIKTATNEFTQKHQRYPSTEELSELISLEIDKIEKALQADTYITSMDAPLTDDDGTTMADMLSSDARYSSDRNVDYESMCTELMQVLCSVLNERERNIVIQSFGIGCPEKGLDDIGYEMGLTRERVRQIRERGLEKMRKSCKSRLLLKHLG